MTNHISGLVFVVLLLVGAALTLLVALASPVFAIAVAVAWAVCSLLVALSIQLAAQWEQGLVFRLGKFHTLRGPGIFLIVPVMDQVRLIDTRIRATDIPVQQAITKDNVPVTINGVLFFQVESPADAVIKVQDYRYAISQYAQTSLRDVIGQMTLDELLVNGKPLARRSKPTWRKTSQAGGLRSLAFGSKTLTCPKTSRK